MKKETMLITVVALYVVVGGWALGHVIADPDWYVGKTYTSEPETTIAETEHMATEETATEEQTTERGDDASAAAHEIMTRFVPPETEEPTEAETEAQTEAPTPAPTARPTEAPTVKETQMSTGIVHYSIDGVVMDPTLQDILYTTLREAGMDWWMPYAVAQARAESGAQFNVYAVSKDGKDKGLFQYREKYWQAKAARVGLQNADIFNPVNQIYVYVFEMTSRYKSGMTDVAQLISAHKTAGYGYDAAYVEYVMGFVNKLKIVR